MVHEPPNENYEKSGGITTTMSSGPRNVASNAMYDMNDGNLIASRVQHLMDMSKNLIVMTTSQCTVSIYSAKPWIRRLPMTEVLTIMRYDEQQMVLIMRPPVPRIEDIMRSKASETCPNPVR